MTDDVARLRVHADYSRRIARQSLARAIDRGADALERLEEAESLLADIAGQDYRGNEPADRALARRYFERHPR